MFNIFKNIKKEENNEEPKSQDIIQENQKEETEDTEFTQDENSKSFFNISFSGLKKAVSKTNDFFSENITSIGINQEKIDDDLLDEMEERLIRADIGVNTSVYLIEKLRANKNKIRPDEISQFLKNEFKELINNAGSASLNIKEGRLNIILITGVNGAGKTTLIGKLAYRYKMLGKKVLVAAGDTFRAAAEDQLEIWTQRAGADIIRQDNADPASVVFDAIKSAKSNNYDILLIDTAGRLHNKFNLMEELGKIKKIIDRESAEFLSESLLVIDATTGQNGMKQAEVFKEAVDLTGVALTKLDGTARGGVVVGIAKELQLPIKLIGVGEKMEDMKDFTPDNFVEALFSKN